MPKGRKNPKIFFLKLLLYWTTKRSSASKQLSVKLGMQRGTQDYKKCGPKTSCSLLRYFLWSSDPEWVAAKLSLYFAFGRPGAGNTLFKNQCLGLVHFSNGCFLECLWLEGTGALSMWRGFLNDVNRPILTDFQLIRRYIQFSEVFCKFQRSTGL